MLERAFIRDTAKAEYLNGKTFEEYLALVADAHPFLLNIIDDKYRISGMPVSLLDEMNSASWEFEGKLEGGRGASYNSAQRTPGNRGLGMEALLGMFPVTNGERPSLILDVLAGDGTLSRFAESRSNSPIIISADLSRFMADACIAHGLPCIRQSAGRSLIKNNALDGVIIAYGSHHLDHAERRRAALEAYRTLKPGGKFILHDFEVESPMERWFQTVVHPYSSTGHPHQHFSRTELRCLFEEAGFVNVEIKDMYDPFILSGDTATEAKRNVLMHLYEMYDLSKIKGDNDGHLEIVERLVQETLGKIELVSSDGQWAAKLSRTAIVCSGIKYDSEKA